MNDLETVESATHELSVEQVIARVNKVHEIMKRAMVNDHHYGIIPGTEKPTLLKPGMELLCLAFRLDPQYTATPTRDSDGHYSVISTCTLYHIPTGQRLGSGMGQGSTRETKYAYRKAARTCPSCGKETIIKGKAEYGGGWLCWTKKEGCGKKFGEQDPAIVSQAVGRVMNEDIADTENTVLKMSNKRALGAAVLNVTAASDIFTVDLEDQTPPEATITAAPPAPPANSPKTSSPAAGPSQPPPTPPPAAEWKGPPRPITPAQVGRLYKILNRTGVQRPTLEAKWGPIEQMAMADYDRVCAWAESAGNET